MLELSSRRLQLMARPTTVGHCWHPPPIDDLCRSYPHAPREDLVKLSEAFQMFDKDNSGTIDIGEFQYIIAAHQGATNPKVR